MANILQKLGLAGNQELQDKYQRLQVHNQELEAKVGAILSTQAVIEFDQNGNILDANENFLKVMGYQKSEVVGHHHSMFVTEKSRSSSEYQQFWDALRRGESRTGEYHRLGKNNKDIWLHGSYTPLMDGNRHVYKVIKSARDMSEEKVKNADFEGQIEAIGKSQAVIEFNMDGTIITANDKFLSVMDYRLDEIVGKHHSLFVDPEFVRSVEYRDFWQKLNDGKFEAAEYKRLGKGGKEVWIQGSYNPIFDQNGRPIKVVKYATDVTEQKIRNADFSGQIEAIGKSQAVISFKMDGTIIEANDNFLNTIGYRLEDIQGKHHSMFVMPEERTSVAYKQFWESLNNGQFLSDQFKRLGNGGKEIWLQASYNPILDPDGRPFKVVKYATDITEEKNQEVKNRQIADIASALKIVNSSVLLADNNMDIVYVNESALSMFRNRESELRGGLPAFDANSLVGKNIDVFHKNPSHNRRVIEGLRDTLKTEIEINGLTFRLIASPWFGVDGTRVGTINELVDRTAEVTMEKEIDDMVQAASAGDFTKQIAIEDKTGFFKNLSAGLNQFSGTVEVALNDILRMFGAMAKGDLSERITREYDGSFAQLKADANDTADKLTEIIGKIRSSSGAILSAANEIAQGNADLSQRTEEQASSLEETASSMEEMTSTVKQSSDNAQRANDLSQQAQVKAREGGDVVSRAVTAMEEINASSKKISDIIGVIDEIAFQTNLLALNAAVEAARAGEQGRGFAVVAGEVRNLAQRSAGAAKEIKDLIRDSVAKVQDGRELVNASGETLEEIVAAVENVSLMMREIAEASQEQTSGIEQVNTAISQMDEMTQQNAALVEEASAAGAALADQANSMNSVVEFFTVGGATASAAAAPMASPSRMSSPPKAHKPMAVPKSKPSASLDDDDEWEEF